LVLVGRVVALYWTSLRMFGFMIKVQEWYYLSLNLSTVVNPLYEKAQEYEVPVLIHSGNEPAPMIIKYSQPKYIDAVAADFPDLKIIIAHMGHGWWREAVDLASMKPNVYLDFSGWQTIYINNPDYLWYPLRMAIDLLGPWRVLFGTDGSMLNVVMPLKNWVEAVKNPKSPLGIEFSSNEIEIIMGKAAAKLYKIQ
ncbi:MAG: amidohydrolase family protein, partial [Candidatus Jordarchaeum sp.]|uniref:amidohydrolase family protein n=1 Tax=Candidatus Jordarchaeum sp. TaxID=2823881 RepID=UPI004048F54E